LQNAAFLPLFRGSRQDSGLHLDKLEPLAPSAKGDEAIAEIFADVGPNTILAARKVLSHLATHPDPTPFADAARRLIFLKGSNSHDYKFSAAVLEDYPTLAAPWRDRLLAASVFYLRGSGAPDNALVARTRAALSS
jgi:hypothetical protein